MGRAIVKGSPSPLAESPLSRLAPDERARAIAALDGQLPRDDALPVLTALVGSQSEVTVLPRPLQLRAQAVLLGAFPDGANALVVSRLGIAGAPTEAWLPALQTRIDAMTVDEAVATLPGWRSDAPAGRFDTRR